MKSIIALGLLACSGLASAATLDCSEVVIGYNEASVSGLDMRMMGTEILNHDGSKTMMFSDFGGHQLVVTVYKKSKAYAMTYVAQNQTFSNTCSMR
ncbi:hypothetical protein PQC38_gp002 [Aeromonas phage BUCT695]|uniref:hypothetical protein n=1 Tax=Aeromonas phage BUCT695 TaxID=2908630 RepID=UPI00232969B3|nr:hypothetical protein PQC38_gp002 [Aeromonas phage BUCT695]UIW10478.1 hypothetical protein [Aeromonas phage BUCT695]